MSDYREQDEAYLLELIERYRNGYGVSHIVEVISVKWAEQGRIVYDTEHKERKDIPLTRRSQEIFDQLMSELGDDDGHRF